LSLEPLIEFLLALGVKPLDSKVYFFLAKKGPFRCKDLCKTMKLTKQQLYPSLKNLNNKGIVNATSRRPAIFIAVPLEKVLDNFANSKIEEAENTKKARPEILRIWHSMINEGPNDNFM
jgi:sugar-specific transcriptional regulator TrmB